jgi:hypothetical protein
LNVVKIPLSIEELISFVNETKKLYQIRGILEKDCLLVPLSNMHWCRETLATPVFEDMIEVSQSRRPTKSRKCSVDQLYLP